jgi:drug/metabolite transporter (DMT)-like permease
MMSVSSSARTRAPSGREPASGPAGSRAGMAAGIGASLVWGTAFLVPVLLGGWNPVIVTLGRYLVYGLLSASLLIRGGRDVRRILRTHWRAALAFAIAGNAGYYLLLTVAIAAAGAPLTDMVIGAIPVVVAVAGNILTPAVRWRRLLLPLALVTTGLALVSALELSGVHAYLHVTAGEKMAGLAAAVGAVVLWTWYALANARFLSRVPAAQTAAHPTDQPTDQPADQPALSPASWSTAVGVATGAVALAALPAAALTGQLAAPRGAHASLAGLIAGAIFLGVAVSWLGTAAWNVASSRLSAVMAGLLVNLETVTGFGYVYAARRQWPPPGQLAGLVLVMAGVVLTMIISRPGRSPA